jgi:GPH family glycoside/pentoside/hexuronide:cation symporter
MDSADAKIAGGGSTTAAHTSEPLTLKTKLLYGAPSFAGAGMVIPIFINMPKFYADTVLVPLGYLAMAIAIARSLDALSDPLMGWISDHTHTRLGRRRPYILLGAPLCGIAFFCLLNPPAALTGGRAAMWFGTTFILYFIFHTVYVLPHYALGPELTQNYNERSTLFAWRESFTILGTIVAAAAPGALQAFHMTERRSFFWLGIFFGILLSVLYGLLVLNIKERPDFVARESNPLVPGVRRALRNRPFAILLASYVVGSIAGAIPATMMPFFPPIPRPGSRFCCLVISVLDFSRCRCGFTLRAGSESSMHISPTCSSASAAAVSCFCWDVATTGGCFC